MALSKIDVSKMITGVTPLANGGTGGTSIPATNLASGVTGTLPVGSGGTGLTSGTTDQILKFTGSTTLASAAEAAGGKLLQVVTQTKNSDSFTTSNSYSTVFTCAITPSATSSKILLIGSIQYNNYGNGSTSFPHGTIQLLTNSDATLCRAYGNFSGNVSTDQTDRFDSTLALVAYDSPNSTSAQTYKVSYKTGAGRFGIMGAGSNRNDGSSLTLIEIAA